MQFMLTTIIQLLTLCWQPTCIKFSIIWSQNTAHYKLHILITLQVSVTHTSTIAEMGNFWGCWMNTDKQLITTRNKSVFPILLYFSSLLWLKKFYKLHTTKTIKWSFMCSNRWHSPEYTMEKQCSRNWRVPQNYVKWKFQRIFPFYIFQTTLFKVHICRIFRIKV